MEQKYSYLVCTRCFTYNHEAYILDALSGFVAQKTSFPVLYTIVDDASTDNEPQILRDFFFDNFDTRNSGVAYQEETDYGTILYAQHKENKNCFFALLLLRENHKSQNKRKIQYLTRWIDNVKYIALCEGDDYWTDPLKLQKQVDILEQNEEVTLCCTACDIKTDDCFSTQRRYKKERVVPPIDIIKKGGLWLHTVTYVYRSSLMDNYPSYCRSCHVGDFPRLLWSSLNGSVYYLPDVTAVYRYQSSGSWTSKRESLGIDRLIAGWRSEVNMLEGLDQYSEGKYSNSFNARIRSYVYDAIINHKADVKKIAEAFREEIKKLFDRKQRMHVWALRMHLGSAYEFLLRKDQSRRNKIHKK